MNSFTLSLFFLATTCFFTSNFALTEDSNFFSQTLCPDLYNHGYLAIVDNPDLFLADMLYSVLHSVSIISIFLHMRVSIIMILFGITLSLLYVDYTELYKKTAHFVHPATIASNKEITYLYFIKKFFDPIISLALCQLLSHFLLQLIVTFLPSENYETYVNNAASAFKLMMPFSSLFSYMCSLAYGVYYDKYVSSPYLLLSFALGGIFWISRRTIRNLSLTPQNSSFLEYFYSFFFYFYIYVLTFLFATSEERLLPFSNIFKSDDMFYSIFLITLLLFWKNLYVDFKNFKHLFTQVAAYVRLDYFYSVAFIAIMGIPKLSGIIANYFNISGFSLSALECIDATPLTYFIFYISKIVGMSL